MSETMKPTSTVTSETSLTDAAVQAGRDALLAAESSVQGVGSWLWGAFHDRPYVGGIAGAALGFGLVTTLGVAELVVSLLVGYAGYRMLAYGESPGEAIEKTLAFRGGKLLEEVEEETET